jgi:hypothetical protein
MTVKDAIKKFEVTFYSKYISREVYNDMYSVLTQMMQHHNQNK